MNELSVAQGGLMPQTFEAKYQMAGVLSRSGLIPQGLNSPEKVCVALQWGHELGLSPMVAVNNVAVINGKPTLSADIMAAVVKRSPEYGGIKWLKLTDTEAECEITRILPNGEKESITSSFSMQDAQKAGLASRDVWRKYPKRMLKHRCLSYGLKDMFPDLLAGLYTPEEMESVDSSEPPKERNVTPVEQPVQETPIVEKKEVRPTIDEREVLKKIIGNYEQQLSSSDDKPTPFDRCCEALAENDPVKIHDMIQRSFAYLGRKGIQVSV